MRFTSPSRRALGVFAVSTIGMSTAILGIGGVAQATGPTTLTGETPLTVPAGTCTVEWVLNGGTGGDSTGYQGGAGAHMALHMSAAPGDTMLVNKAIYAGGTGGTGAGNGGEGIALIVDGDVQAVAAGGGGAGSLADGGAAEAAGADAPDNTGGSPGTADGPGLGGTNGTGGTDGAPGSDTAGGDGGAGAGGGGGGLYGGGSGATEGTDGAGGGGGANQNPTGEDVTAATGVPSITYEFQACTTDEMPHAPHDVTVQGGDRTLTVDFYPTYSETGGVDADTWEYQVGAGAWTTFEPDYTDWGPSELVLPNLTNGTTYTVRVRGVSSDGVPGPAATVTGAPFKAIGAPSGLAVTAGTSSVRFTWDAPTTPGTFALDGYVATLSVNYGESGGPVFQCTTAPSVRVCEAPAAPGLNYSVSVFAVDTAGNDGEWTALLPVGKVAAPATVPSSDGTMTVPAGDAGGVVHGEKITVHGTGYKPNSLVSVVIYSTPQVLTSVMTDGAGSFTVEVTVPAGLAAGHHTLVAAGVDPSGAMRYMTLPVTVTAGVATLAYTGASIMTPAIGGLVFLVVGAGLLFLSRRRTTS